MKTLMTFLMSAVLAAAQVNIPDGTKLRVRLDQTISSSTAEQGQTVELSVTEPVKVGDELVIPEGSRVTGTITKRRKSVIWEDLASSTSPLTESVQLTVSGSRCVTRLTNRNGGSHAVSTGVLTAGAAVLFWPAAPAFLLIKGKDVTINKGVVFDAFTDRDHVLANAATSTSPIGQKAVGGTANVTITSNTAGADIEVDGAYVGSTPSTLPLISGAHQISVRSGNAMWQRNLQINAGSSITVNAMLEQVQVVARRAR